MYYIGTLLKISLPYCQQQSEELTGAVNLIERCLLACCQALKSSEDSRHDPQVMEQTPEDTEKDSEDFSWTTIIVTVSTASLQKTTTTIMTMMTIIMRVSWTT